jgi:hypothetical protein
MYVQIICEICFHDNEHAVCDTKLTFQFSQYITRIALRFPLHIILYTLKMALHEPKHVAMIGFLLIRIFVWQLSINIFVSFIDQAQ